MKFLITGGAGMIGSRLVKLMVEKSYEVAVIDNLWRGKLKYLENIKGFDVEKNFINQDLSVNNPFQILKHVKIQKLDLRLLYEKIKCMNL